MRQPARMDGTTHLGSQTDDLPPALHAQICTDDATYARTQHLALVVEEHSGIVVEPDKAAVWPADGLARADDDSAADVALADLGRGGRGLARDWASAFDDTDDLVADAAPAVVDFLLQDVDALDEDGPRVVYDLEEARKRCTNGERAARTRTLSVLLRPIILEVVRREVARITD